MYDAVQFLNTDACFAEASIATLKFKFVKSHICKGGIERSRNIIAAKVLTVDLPYVDEGSKNGDGAECRRKGWQESTKSLFSVGLVSHMGH